MFAEAPLDDETMAAVLEQHWAMTPAALEYRRIGYGSYHWLVTAEDGSLWFVTVESAGGPFAARHAYAVAHALAERGLDFVRAPRLRVDGLLAAEVGEWWISVWPWLDGRATLSGEHSSTADLVATLRCVRELHEVDVLQPVPELVENWELPGRRILMALLADEGWGGGPYVEEARRLLYSGAEQIQRNLARYDELVAELGVSNVDFVITHGEPHAANVVHTAGGPVLIDWDTLRWAPRERDLWSLIGIEGWRNGYGDVPVSRAGVEVYRLQWELSEIASFARLLASAGATNPDADVAMRELRAYLVA